ncbi:hypothetical protein Q0F98_02200 [Paenibacillus amylolyticus]|nr:hypothetical protein Q0F98_02200 [Paenibacillus amylolyticus]
MCQIRVPPAAVGTDRTSSIIQAAQAQAAAYGVPDHKFLLAICRHETVLGTQGKGKDENGSFILGYGCPSTSDCNPLYKGIQEQMKGAERMSKALASRGKKVSSKADVLYFHNGGDIAPMTWSQDQRELGGQGMDLLSGDARRSGKLDHYSNLHSGSYTNTRSACRI